MCSICNSCDTLRGVCRFSSINTVPGNISALVRISAGDSLDTKSDDTASEVPTNYTGELPKTEGRDERDTGLFKSLDPVSEGGPTLIDSGGYTVLGVPIAIRTMVTAPIDDIIFNSILKGLKNES